MKAVLKGVAPALLVAVMLGAAFAKIPASAPMDPARAEEKKAKDAAAAATVAAQQAKAEDRAAALYLQSQKAKGKAVTPHMASNAAELDVKAKEAVFKAAAATGASAVGLPPVAAVAVTSTAAAPKK